MWPDSRKSFLLLEKSVMKQLALLCSSYPSGYPWSRREGQVISLAVPFLWFCAQRRHVRCESCEGKVLSPCRNAVLWSGGDERKHWWKGTVMSLFPLLLLIWNVITFGFTYLHSPPPPPTPFLFFFFIAGLFCGDWFSLGARGSLWLRIAPPNVCLWGLSPSSRWWLLSRITSIIQLCYAS